MSTFNEITYAQFKKHASSFFNKIADTSITAVEAKSGCKTLYMLYVSTEDLTGTQMQEVADILMLASKKTHALEISKGR